MMLESINIFSPIAVYLQIENEIRFAIARGDLKADDQLPAVQKLAKQLDINFNTVAKAYRDLEVMGLIYTRRGMGCFIQKNVTNICKERCTNEIIGRLHEVTQEAVASGMSKKSIRDALSVCFDTDSPVYGEAPKKVMALAKTK
jgi:GntR family transcriptional regulator